MTLKGKVAIVTGGNSGIGKAIVLALAEQGANVVIDYVADEQATEDLEKQVAALGDQSIGVEADVSKVEDLERLVKAAVDAFGRLDIMVNNAGIETRTSTLDTTEAQYEKVMDVNLKSAFLTMKHVIPLMVVQGGGSIINISSVAATIAFPGISVYSATKSGVDRLTRVAAMESGKLGYGVRVNCIYPGLVPTQMGMKLAADVVAAGLFASPEAAVGAIIEQTPAGRLGEVSEMADAVVFLCSDAARFITGAGLPVDGGMGM